MFLFLDLMDKVYMEIINMEDIDKNAKRLEKILNKRLSKKFDWFDHIELNSVGFSDQIKSFSPVGYIYVDSDWLGNQWRKYNYSRPIEYEYLTLGDIIGIDDSNEIQEIFKTSWDMLGVQDHVKRMSFSWLEVKPVDMEKDMIEESIKRILKEETKKDKLVYRYITSLIQPHGKFKQEYNHDAHRFDITDNNDNLLATTFFNNRKEAMEVMIDESIWQAVSEMFSMETWDEVNDSLVKWFQDNYDGLENLEEVTTFDNAEYAY